MTDYEKNKWYITNQVIEIADLIKKQEEEIDKIQKVNVYLMQRYKDELLEEFKATPEGIKGMEIVDQFEVAKKTNIKDYLLINFLYDSILKEMKEQMPDPWYCYSIGGNLDDGEAD